MTDAARIKKLSLAIARRTKAKLDNYSPRPTSAKEMTDVFCECLEEAESIVRKRHNATELEMSVAVDLWLDVIENKLDELFPLGHG